MTTFQNLLTDHDLTTDSGVVIGDWSPALQGSIRTKITLETESAQELPAVLEYYSVDLNGQNAIKIGEQEIGALRTIQLMINVTPPKIAVKYVANSTDDEGVINVTANRDKS